MKIGSIQKSAVIASPRRAAVAQHLGVTKRAQALVGSFVQLTNDLRSRLHAGHEADALTCPEGHCFDLSALPF